MSTKLLEITPQYRSFVDDQVLTSGQLNEFIEYFEDQDRLTRVCLVGVGLACGFKISVNNAKTLITITQGCGVTTDGDLLKLQQNIKNSSDTSIDIESITYSHFTDFEDDKAKYKHFKNENNTIDLWELIPQEKIDLEAGHLPINQDLLKNKVAVLYLECYPKAPDICTTTNCDNQGQPNIQNLRVLLISSEDVENIVNPKDGIFSKHNVYEALSNLPPTAIPKVILNDSNANSYSKIAATYKSAINSSKEILKTAFTELFQGFSDVLEISESTSNTILSNIDNLDDFNSNEKIQYRYDLVRDISDTYNELIEILLKLKTECCPSISAFPKHILLGLLFSEVKYPELRHEFYHSPANNEYAKYLKIAKSLLQRLILLLKNFNLSEENQVDITPSKTCGNLGLKAIPIYYETDAALLNAWDFNKTENYKQEYNIGYHRENLAPNSWVKNPLNFETDCNNFYRIEGHVGHPAQDSRNAINNLKNSHALDFDCVLFDLQRDAQAFTSFIRENPSIAHKAGVSKGGTFILVSENEQIVADFCLTTKVNNTTDGGCCSLMECTYPWISSLKYMNNLSRSLKGQQSRNKPMPQNYVLQVIEYKINGEPLINRTTTITIPLKEIFLRRIHAVTEALNNKFDKGVVFDFNENQKRLVITRAKEDTFTIRLREISMANNNAIYTYSNNGMFRNNLVFRPDAMRCRDLRSYRESFYQKLHAQIAPVNKDDDYGKYDEKWAKWSKLTERLISNPVLEEAGLIRMITSKQMLPKEIKTLVSNIKRDFQATQEERNLNFELDGNWVNGIWVNKFMLDHHRRNRKNTHDDIVLFVNLRKYLHNETGVTKLSVYITNLKYAKNLDEVIAKYKTKADFYFGKPTGENAISL
ncbi:hypothetical protein [Aequorivita marisscotiae]|uniref:Uncharacterized protein n=1 Tax=Aequorivita marisscotiae TaxID=3040348 RepID=A0ABY8KS12_9FLAO|nr:hypothetical protein [Aequorivita sp. Ant34-E75]WGF91813.1 hypothetical protein QCQ61_11400 [Aequorivita sp. Ant34-E75]